MNAGAAAMAATAAITVVLAAWSARRARTTGDFYVAARAVPPWWNASAISGEYLSAASFLGVAGLIMVGGADAIWFPVGYAVGYVLLLALVSAPLRRSGAYTLPDFCEARLRSGLVRTAASVLVVTIGWLYVVPQLQGAGLALRTILGTPAWVGGVAVALTVLSVIISGGMRSVTFAQAFQYWLKLVAIAVPILVLLAVWRLDGSPSAIAPAPPAFAETTTVVFDRAVEVQVAEPLPVVAGGEPALLPAGRQALGPGPVEFPAGAPVPHIVGTTALPGQVWGQPLQANDHALYRTYALMVALFLGTMGLPHILVRFYTNPDGRQARRTALIVIGLVGAFYLAPATYGMLGRLYAPQLLMTGQADAVVLLLPRAMLDGAPGVWLSALVAAGAAAAFLATATGLTVTVAGVLSQDVVSRRVADPIVAFRLAAAVAVLSPLALSLVAGRLPLAQSVALAFAVAASTFCPLLLLGIWWRGLTDAGAAAGLGVGGLLSLAAIAVSAAAPGLTGWPAALLAQPAAWTMPAAFAVMVGVSLATKHRVLPDVHRIMVRLHTPEGTGVRQSWSARGTRGL